MKILWLSWKDRAHPLAGGAEAVNEALAERLVADGHEVVFIVGGFAGATHKEEVHGYTIIRLGNRYAVYWQAYRYYKAHLQGWADLVIDEVNTIPFFAKWYVRERNVLFIHQLSREVWFYQMIFPLSLVGFWLEWFYLRLLNDQHVVTVSDSTRQDLLRFGFRAERITVISEGIEMEPVKQLSRIKKYGEPTLLSLGAIRPMKRTYDQIKAFEIAKQTLPNLKLKVAGDADGRYGQKILRMIAGSPYAADIEYLGKVPAKQKRELMQRAHAIMVTSIKEGWGLIVTEAASQGTPAIVYDVDGLRDSVQHDKTGIVAKQNNPQALAAAAVQLCKDKRISVTIGKRAHAYSKQITFAKSYKQFKQAAGVR